MNMFWIIYCVTLVLYACVMAAGFYDDRRKGEDITLGTIVGFTIMGLIPVINTMVFLLSLIAMISAIDYNKVIFKGKK